MTILYSIFPLIVSVMLLILGVFVYKSNKEQYLNKIFLGLCLTSSCWLFFVSLAYIVKNEHIAFVLLKMCYCGVVFIPITIFHYIVEFLKIKKIKIIALYNYLIGFICIILIWTTPFIVGGMRKYFWGYYPIAGILHPLFLVYFILFGAILTSLLLLYKYYYSEEKLSYLKKEQIKYVLLAFSSIILLR